LPPKISQRKLRHTCSVILQYVVLLKQGGICFLGTLGRQCKEQGMMTWQQLVSDQSQAQCHSNIVFSNGLKFQAEILVA
jgi:hypothetical protein